MLTITQFTLQPNQNKLLMTLNNGDDCSLPFEYLRVFSPLNWQENKFKQVIGHKKLVKIMAIELVGKHGYRLIFDDEYQAIYSVEFIASLVKNEAKFWPLYLTELKQAGLTREAKISIQQL